MGLIEWRDEFSVGVAAVDHEHRELIELINAAYRQISDKGSATEPGSVESVMASLGEVYARIAAHFALEEKLMREQRYDKYHDHKADHERLLDEIRDLMDDFEGGAIFDRDDLAERLERWFIDHFKTKDARLHRYLRV